MHHLISRPRQCLGKLKISMGLPSLWRVQVKPLFLEPSHGSSFEVEITVYGGQLKLFTREGLTLQHVQTFLFFVLFELGSVRQINFALLPYKKTLFAEWFSSAIGLHTSCTAIS